MIALAGTIGTVSLLRLHIKFPAHNLRVSFLDQERLLHEVVLLELCKHTFGAKSKHN